MVVIAIGSAPLGGGRALARLLGGSAHHRRRRFDRLDDVHVPGAPAEVALQTLSDVVIGRVWVLRQQVGGGQDESGRAVAALQSVLVPESLLERVQLPAAGEALDV